jgi:Berberine and berberine like
MTYPEMYPPEPPAEGGPPIAIGRTVFTDAFDLDAAREVIARLGASDARFRAVQLRVLGGAMARVPVDATAFAHRDRRIMVVAVSFSDGSAGDRARRQTWTDDMVDALRQGEGGAYVNFISDEDPARVREAYPDATWQRLTEVKRRYDAGNLFHLNGNIPPG